MVIYTMDRIINMDETPVYFKTIQPGELYTMANQTIQ
jgi:hypothetical protein